MKNFRGTLINFAIYAIVTITLVLSMNIYVNKVEQSKENILWQKYKKERQAYMDMHYKFGEPPSLEYLKLEEDFHENFAKKHGHEKDFNPLKLIKFKFTQNFSGGLGDLRYSPLIEEAKGLRSNTFGLYFIVITPLWLTVSLLVFLIKRSFFTPFRIQATIVGITTIWILLTTYIPALSTSEMHLANAVVRIIVPVAIAWGLVYLVNKKKEASK